MKLPINLNHKIYGSGRITEINNTDNHVLMSVIFDSGLQKHFAADIILNKDILVLEPALLTELKEYTKNQMILIEEESRQNTERYLKQVELDQKERERLVREQKENLKLERAIKKLDTLKPESITNDKDLIIWMANHVKSISAAMPDFAESWFVKNFGDVKGRRVVDSKKLSPAGWTSQWAVSFSIAFDQEVPAILMSKAKSKNKKVINSVNFVWDLIDNYGFKFGKKQDIDLILSNI